MGAALAQKACGINILLYGETGAGKTALARALAHELQTPMYMAAFADKSGDSLSGNERMASFALGQRLIAPGTGLMLFDEFDEVLDGRTDGLDQGGLSKNWLNTLLETNATPAIYVANAIDGIDPAHLRRFAFVVQFGPSTLAVRKQTLMRLLKPDEALDAEDIATVCASYTLAPGHLALAFKTCRLMAGRPHLPTLKTILAPHKRLDATACTPAASEQPLNYDVAMVASSSNLVALTADLAAAGRGKELRASLLLYGPPGTGKSAYLRHLAHEMGRSVVYRTSADLLGAKVGQTERAMAKAFWEAQEANSVLIFDQVDSFLSQREASMRGWEVSGVATFLQQLEHFQGVVGCTTNHFEHLDTAALRRFTFKAELKYPSTQQRKALFQRILAPHLKTPLAAQTQNQVEQALANMAGVTVGDFTVVAQQAAVLRQLRDIEHMLEALAAECRHRKALSQPIGFR